MVQVSFVLPTTRVIVMLIVWWSGSKPGKPISITRLDAGFNKLNNLLKSAQRETRQCRNCAGQWNVSAKRDISNRKGVIFYDFERLIDHCPLICSNECLRQTISHFWYFPFMPIVRRTHNDPINDNKKTKKLTPKREKRHRQYSTHNIHFSPYSCSIDFGAGVKSTF